MIGMYGGYIVGSFDNLKQITAGPYRFIDTSTLLQASLKKLCKSFKVPEIIAKMEHDFDSEYENNYFKWDVPQQVESGYDRETGQYFEYETQEYKEYKIKK